MAPLVVTQHLLSILLFVLRRRVYFAFLLSKCSTLTQVQRVPLYGDMLQTYIFHSTALLRFTSGGNEKILL